MQIVEPLDDGSVSELDQSNYDPEDIIDLTGEYDEGAEIAAAWDVISRDMHEG